MLCYIASQPNPKTTTNLMMIMPKSEDLNLKAEETNQFGFLYRVVGKGQPALSFAGSTATQGSRFICHASHSTFVSGGLEDDTSCASSN